jgi:hypothetical protein
VIRKSKKSSDRKNFSVDALMTKLSLTLVRDFQNILTDPCYADTLQAALRRGDIAKVREEMADLKVGDDVSHFKATYQLQSLLKRYRYQDDIYSDQELQQKSINDFLATQDRLRGVDLDNLPAFSRQVLIFARRYIARVLGEYNDEEHRSLCRFGSGASVGVPSRLACLAERWELPISGSPNQIDWFDAEMRETEHVQEYWRAQQDSDPPHERRSIYQSVDSLTLTLVPKTFKSLRAIMPNTTIGSYMSFGLGEMIRKRLKRVGYNISDLQMRHRDYARRGSIHSLYTTADLSAASDSITDDLVRLLFPSDWFEILNRSRIGTVALPDGSVVQSKTFCTMGIGYTFPLQTLVFLALLWSIQVLLYGAKDRFLISVYGDDMVYPSRIHPHVVEVFSSIGFVINLDKTFHEGHFRESCGGDYYRGVDVRPFQPRNGAASVSSKAYEAILYKYTNGLLVRWSEYEIGNTLQLLMSELEALVGRVKIVPKDFPDDSGVKCSLPLSYTFLAEAKIAKPKAVGHGQFRFSYLRLKPKEREEKRHEPYYWEALSGRDLVTVGYSDASHIQEKSSKVICRIDYMTGADLRESRLILRDVKPIETFRSSLSGRRLRRKQTLVVVPNTGVYVRQSGTSRFEDRR